MEYRFDVQFRLRLIIMIIIDIIKFTPFIKISSTIFRSFRDFCHFWHFSLNFLINFLRKKNEIKKNLQVEIVKNIRKYINPKDF